ncbi:hypothetical protein B0T24DRAFT_669611 [Lasiosphaeria ovina]|uniref:Uncharacterized protein n=1 Tax=Lasiosphaeria ovina TaxID=92902 RepID=A0AAE0N1Z9_9PEZI|nr:hypothetical protein B0T24DRAFT_669611 [Lasiosphaeria ovina]
MSSHMDSDMGNLDDGCVSPPYFIDGNPLPERWSLRGQEPESGDPRVAVWQLENRQFPGCITVPETTAAAKFYAREAQMAPDVVAGALRLSYFTDGSVESPLQGEARDKFAGVRGGYGVVSKIPFLNMGADEWHEEAFFTDNAFSIDHMEMAGIAQCLRNALDFVDEFRAELSARNIEAVKVDVFTDSTSSLEAIKNGIQPRLGKTDLYTAHVLPIVKTVVCLSHALHARNSNVEFHWVPRCSVLKHERADALAGRWKSDKNANVNIDYDESSVPAVDRKSISAKLRICIDDAVEACRQRSAAQDPPQAQPKAPATAVAAAAAAGQATANIKPAPNALPAPASAPVGAPSASATAPAAAGVAAGDSCSQNGAARVDYRIEELGRLQERFRSGNLNAATLARMTALRETIIKQRRAQAAKKRKLSPPDNGGSPPKKRHCRQ